VSSPPPLQGFGADLDIVENGGFETLIGVVQWNESNRVADNIAETPGDLMFLTGDKIVVLKELDDISYLVSPPGGIVI
jgi:hypothetical protein